MSNPAGFELCRISLARPQSLAPASNPYPSFRSVQVGQLTKGPSSDLSRSETALAVRIGAKLHAIPIAAVEEVLPALPIEPVPQCPSFVLGVVFVRGHVIPVLSAAERLGLKEHVRTDEPNIVCLRINGRLVGVEFDEAIDLIQIAGDESLTARDIGATEGFFTGVVDHDGEIIRLLNPERLISEAEAVTLNSVQGLA